MPSLRHQSGLSVIEVLIATGMAALLVVAVGSSLNATTRLTSTSEQRATALAYAKETVETLTASAADVFSCDCTADACADTDADGTLDRCSRASDGAGCTLIAGYTSCWTEFADGTVTNDTLHVETAAGTTRLVAGSEVIAGSPAYTRSVTIANEAGDPNRKRLTVDVDWTWRDIAKQTRLETILTAWKNI